MKKPKYNEGEHLAQPEKLRGLFRITNTNHWAANNENRTKGKITQNTRPSSWKLVLPVGVRLVLGVACSVKTDRGSKIGGGEMLIANCPRHWLTNVQMRPDTTQDLAYVVRSRVRQIKQDRALGEPQKRAGARCQAGEQGSRLSSVVQSSCVAQSALERVCDLEVALVSERRGGECSAKGTSRDSRAFWEAVPDVELAGGCQAWRTALASGASKCRAGW
ncbi:hypothetical protein K438DRAFT_1941912 [Mycena galopus ATCC 62051]|nr:hypothetical protein K438DRAFT_1941912 [Mycena galopus ATCC 62051]